jgi:LysM repeat protein
MNNLMEFLKGFTQDQATPVKKEVAQAATKTIQVQAGDTLGQLAKKYGMSVEDISQLNSIADVNKIGVGQKLEVAAPKLATPVPTIAPAQTIQQVPASDPMAMSTAPIRLFSKFIQRKVQSELFGEVEDIQYTEKDFTPDEVSSLYEVASNAWKKGNRRIDYPDYGDEKLEKGIRNLGSDALTSATNIKAQLALTIGQAKVAEEEGRLVLYDTYDFSKIKNAPANFYGKVRKWAGDIGQEGSFPIRMDLGPAPKRESITVAKGDTLHKLAVANNTTVDELAKRNNLTNPDAIKVGQQLVV